MHATGNKIVSLNELASKVRSLKNQGLAIVHCHGVFDLLHIGHIRYFKRAKNKGDILIVTLTPDCYVDKGPYRPAFPEKLRLEAVASLGCVDYVALNLWETAQETLRLISPDFYVKGSEFKNPGSDFTGKIEAEKHVCDEIGCELYFAEDIQFSSSKLINRYFSNLPNELQAYLQLFKNRYTLEDIFNVLGQMKNLKVLVVGDTIVDDYQYCQAMGKSSKDPILSLRYDSNDLFAGGAFAVANHVAGFTNNVTLLTILGEENSHEDFLRAQLEEHISPLFLQKPKACTTLKRRFIDGYSMNKLFEVCFLDATPLPLLRDKEMSSQLLNLAEEHDLVLVTDFGHGTIGPECIRAINTLQCPVVVNTQANSANRGFNTPSKYPGPKLICIAEHELRLETRDEVSPVRQLMERVYENLGLDILVVTRGRQGCTIRTSKGDFISVPSFAVMVKDRVGAGDAFLSIAALAYALGEESEMLGFLGSIMGTLAVGIIGNQKAIGLQDVRKFVTSLLK